MRTLGADSAHRVSPIARYGTSDAQIDSSFDSESNRPPKVVDDQPLMSPSIVVTDTASETKSYISSSSEDSENATLSGEGIFSAPPSRAGSPPILRHQRGSSSEDTNNVLRRRAP